MTDWTTTIASLATGVGTLVLAVATFASVRSANRSSRVAEQALLVTMRPLLTASRADDPWQKAVFQEGRSFRIEGGRGIVAFENGVVYLAMSLRNAGQGIGVIHGWRFQAGREANPPRPDLDAFRLQGLDLAIGPGDVGYWEGAIRDSGDAQYPEAVAAAKDIGMASVDLLYGDQDGRQRVISRMMLRRYGEDGEADRPWLVTVIRHWNLERPDPRQR